MPYMLIFKAYLKDEMKYEEWHYFSNLHDLYAYASWRLEYAGTEHAYDRYDVQVKFTEADNTPSAA